MTGLLSKLLIARAVIRSVIVGVPAINCKVVLETNAGLTKNSRCRTQSKTDGRIRIETLHMSNSALKEARRALGSEWLKNRPSLLEHAYSGAKTVFVKLYPLLKHLNSLVAERIMVHAEEISKGWAFNCQMCGQCILHSTGMTCPMNCPKNLRNGPCGGVRANGHCEVVPDVPCVWVQAYERSQKMRRYLNEMQIVQPPVNRTLYNTSSWLNMVEQRDKIGRAHV